MWGDPDTSPLISSAREEYSSSNDNYLVVENSFDAMGGGEDPFGTDNGAATEVEIVASRPSK